MGLTEEDILAKASKAMAEDIDWSIITTMLISDGWISVYLKNVDLTEVKVWVNNCCSSGRVRHRGKHWIFQNERDAAMFILKWV